MSVIWKSELLVGMEIKDARNLSPVELTALRERAVKAVLDGRSRVEMAELLGVSRQTIGQWVSEYQRRGVDSLVYRQRGRPAGGRLKPKQAAVIAKLVVDRLPDQLKLPFVLWSRDAVSQLIEQRFNLRLSVSTVGRLLRSWNMTPQKPARRAWEQNPEAVKEWLADRYPKVKAEAKAAGATLLWGDEMGIRSDDQVGRTYGLRGQTPVVPVSGNRFGCNMISAISNLGQMYFKVFTERFTTKVFIDFLKRLVLQIDRPIYLIIDGHPVHRSNAVKDWVSQQDGKIRLIALPGYSPELNPDEMVNQDVKSNAVRRKRPRNKDELLTNIRSYLRNRQRKPDLVKRYFQEKHVRYAS
jgi:transposase